VLESPDKSAICFDNSYILMGNRFYASVKPTPVKQPCIVKLNHGLAQDLGIDLGLLESEGWAAIFSGNHILSGADPLAMVYAGHQFGQFVPLYTIKEAKILIEQWRVHYNTVRPHSSLNWNPPAPEALLQFDETSMTN